MKTRPQKDDVWKVEPLPAAADASVAHLSAAELAALLAAASRRISALEAQVGRVAA